MSVFSLYIHTYFYAIYFTKIPLSHDTRLFSFGPPFNFSIILKFLSLSVPLCHLFVYTSGNPSKYSISIPESSARHNLELSALATVSAFFIAFTSFIHFFAELLQFSASLLFLTINLY